MDPAPSLLALLGRGPGIAVFPGAARRLAPPFDQKLKKKSGIASAANVVFCWWSLWPILFIGGSCFGPKCGFDKVFGVDWVTNGSHGVFWALSTSFEKTCMRHSHSFGFHSPWSNQIKVLNMSRASLRKKKLNNGLSERLGGE